MVPSAEHGTPGLSPGDDLRMGRLSPNGAAGSAIVASPVPSAPPPLRRHSPPKLKKISVILVIHI